MGEGNIKKLRQKTYLNFFRENLKSSLIGEKSHARDLNPGTALIHAVILLDFRKLQREVLRSLVEPLRPGLGHTHYLCTIIPIILCK